MLSFLAIKAPPEQQQEWSLCDEDALDKAVICVGADGMAGSLITLPQKTPKLKLTNRLSL